MFELLFPLPFLAFGLFATFWRARAAHWVCEMGKATWKASMIGNVLAMNRLYREERARRVLVVLGPLVLCVGIGLSLLTYRSFRGPGGPAARRQARLYLERRFDDRWPRSLELASGPMDEHSSVRIRYALDGHTGYLLARWSNDHYEFSDSAPVDLPDAGAPRSR